MNRMNLVKLLILLLVLSGSYDNYIYGETGNIHGIVVSVEGSRLAGVKVSVKGQNLSTKTDNTGYYRLPDMKPGTYTLSFSYRHLPVQQKKIRMTKGQGLEVNMMLDPGQLKPVEILVTARKRVELFQDVPISMAVFGDLKLEESGIKDVGELFTVVPGLHRAGAQFDNIHVIRGISSFENSLYSPAGIFIDGTALPIHLMQNPGLLDIQRVEVLKGPQATLYGRNTESGLVNIITKQPGNRWGGRIYGGFGSFRSLDAGLSADGILVRDKLFFRAAVQGARSDGFVENIFKENKKTDGFSNRYTARGTLRWTPSSDWDISFSTGGNRSDDGIGQVRFSEGFMQSDRHRVNTNDDNYRLTRGDNQSLRINYNNRAIDIQSISSRQRFTLEGGGDVDLTPMDLGKPVYNYMNETLSQELRISPADNGKRLWWQLGVYAFHESMDVDTDWSTVPLTWGGGKKAVTDITQAGMAMFGQLRLSLLPGLHLTTGLRLDYQEARGIYTEDGVRAFIQMWEDIRHLELLPKVSLAYDFSDDVMVYASVSKGFLAGGFKYFDADFDAFSYDPEFTWNYETGVKTTLFNNKVVLNASFFYIAISDKQVFEFNPRTFANNVRNAAEAHSLGIELDLEARPVKGLSLTAGLALMESQYDRWSAPEFDSATGSLVDYVYDGYSFLDAPSHTFHVRAHYAHRSGFFGGVEVTGVGKVMGNLKNTIKRDPYQLVNASLGYRGDHFTLTLWCKNIFDTEFIIQSYEWGDLIAVRDGEPIRFGVAWSYRF